MKTANNTTAIKSAILTGAAILMAGFVGVQAAHADDGIEGRGRRDYYVRSERIDIKRDEQRMRDLNALLRDQYRCHDYDGVRITRQRIIELGRDIERDRRELDRERRERERIERELRDRDRYHDHDRHDHDGYRNHE